MINTGRFKKPNVKSIRLQLGAFLWFLLLLPAPAAVRYVNVNNAAPVSPYTNWVTAATNIQDAIDAANPGDQILVTNGVYRAGGRLTGDGTTNRVAVTKAVSLQSVNGVTATVIDGGRTFRCVYLSNGAVLSGFALTNGMAGSGGGVWCATSNAFVANCLMVSNTATYGGGAYSGTLSNCTLNANTVGFGGSGGGAYNAYLMNCALSNNRTLVNGGSGAGASGCLLTNCTLANNVCNGSGATVGGGATGSTLFNCNLSGNQVHGAGSAGGGAYYSTLNNCSLTGGYSDFDGGGAYNCNLTNCSISSNYAVGGGGGVSGGTLVNCVISGNNTASDGGGVYWTTTLYNCLVIGNHAGYGGGGYSCTFIDCTLAGNSANPIYASGGGAYGCTLNNCIVYNNTGAAPANAYSSTMNYCCSPDPGGTGCITNAPLFVNQGGGDFHLQSGSPCINAGTNSYVTTLKDLDGNFRIANGVVDMGAYEYQQPDPLIVTILATDTNVVVGIPVGFAALFSRGATDSWEFGDGTVISNQVVVSHSWAAVGNYPVTLTMFDGSNPGGVNATLVIHVIPPPLAYVDVNSTNPVAPYVSWATAASNIQDAVDAVMFGAHIVVTNGIYQTGGRVVYGSLSNRLVINKPLVVQSVNGPAMTFIQGNPFIGDNAIRCVYMTNATTLCGFTLLDGATRATGDSYKEQSGGGVWCEPTNVIVTNCVILGNTAQLVGGGVYGGLLNGCSLIGNAATNSGGGAYASILTGCLLSNNMVVVPYGSYSEPNGAGASSCILSNCTLVGNIADNGGWGSGSSGAGAAGSTLDNCSIINNTANGDGAGAISSTLRNCLVFGNTCTSGFSGGGGGNNCTFNGCLIASNTAPVGGGAYECSGTNCVLTGNVSIYQGGGASSGSWVDCIFSFNSGSTGGGASADTYGVGAILINCCVFGNTASFGGGGIASCTAWNSIILDNSAPGSRTNYYSLSANALNYCCTQPLPPDGVDNIVNDPAFNNPAGGDFHLQSGSPCINAGNNVPVSVANDLDGNPRIRGGNVDMGAYEFQNPASAISYAWLQQYGLLTDGSADALDSDGDSLNNWQEWKAGTNPTNALSVLRMVSATATNNPPGLAVVWQSVSNLTYFVQSSTNLGLQPAFSTVRSNIIGQAGTTSSTDTNVLGPGPYFYRVGVQ